MDADVAAFSALMFLAACKGVARIHLEWGIVKLDDV